MCRHARALAPGCNSDGPGALHQRCGLGVRCRDPIMSCALAGLHQTVIASEQGDPCSGSRADAIAVHSHILSTDQGRRQTETDVTCVESQRLLENRLARPERAIAADDDQLLFRTHLFRHDGQRAAAERGSTAGGDGSARGRFIASGKSPMGHTTGRAQRLTCGNHNGSRLAHGTHGLLRAPWTVHVVPVHARSLSTSGNEGMITRRVLGCAIRLARELFAVIEQLLPVQRGNVRIAPSSPSRS